MKQARNTWGFAIDAPEADAPADRDIRIVRRNIFCEPLNDSPYPSAAGRQAVILWQHLVIRKENCDSPDWSRCPPLWRRLSKPGQPFS
jgi:hypothetical protein